MGDGHTELDGKFPAGRPVDHLQLLCFLNRAALAQHDPLPTTLVLFNDLRDLGWGGVLKTNMAIYIANK